MVRPVFRIAILTLFLLPYRGQAQDVLYDGMKEINGTQLYVKIIGEGDPIIVIHGGPGLNHQYLEPYLDPLAKHHTLIYFDQRSSGASGLCEKENMTIDNFVEDIEGIRKAFDLGKVTLFAHSWGGILASAYAVKYPDNLRSIIFCSTIPLDHSFDYEVNTALENRMSPADSALRASIMQSEAFRNGDLSSVKQLMKLTFKPSFCDTSIWKTLDMHLPDNYLVASLSFYGLLPDLKKYDYYTQLSGLGVPVLILHGSCDIAPLAADEKLKSSIPGAQLVVFDNAGHFIFMESQKQFLKTVSHFLKGVH